MLRQDLLMEYPVGKVSDGMTPDDVVHQTARKVPPQTTWHKITKHPRIMPYIRWFALAVLINISLLWYAMGDAAWWTNTETAILPLSNLALANFAVGILFRQHYVVNFLFKIATSIPVSWPLSIRWAMGKVYHFGGLHSGCTTVGTLWFGAYLYALVSSWLGGMSLSLETIIVSALLMSLLLGLIVMALPQIRGRYHNSFELMHRLGGWSTLALFWFQLVLLTRDLNPDQSLFYTIISSPSAWVLYLISFSILLPWMQLQKVKVDIDCPSSHVAIAKFNYGVNPFAGSSTALSRSPLREWHSFANIPSPVEDGYRLTISRAGDWTGHFIDDKPSHVWVKAIPTAGVGNVDQLFKRVLWVATGSGIGPCLPHLLAETAPGNLVWSTRTPTDTYGEDLVGEILAVQPDAMIWDTNEHGKPDMIKLVHDAFERFQPEAVICISNQKLTYQVVYDMESRGVPAFGAIWDS